MVNPHGKTYGICKNKCLVEVSPKEDVVHKTDMGIANGVATLGADGKVPVTQIPIFSNSALGGIKGSTSAGKISANADGTGSVNGWNTKADLSGATFINSVEILASSISPRFRYILPVTKENITSTYAPFAVVDSSLTNTNRKWVRNLSNAIVVTEVVTNLSNTDNYFSMFALPEGGGYMTIPTVPDPASNHVVVYSQLLSAQSDIMSTVANTYARADAVGAVNGIASLDSTGKVPSGQLPSRTITDVTGLTDALDGKQDKLTFDNVPASGSANPVKSGGVYTALADKQNKLTFDATPVSGSENPVKSGGIHSALAGKQNSLTFDNAPVSGSGNPVKSGGVYTALDGKQDTLTFDNVPVSGSDNPIKSGGVYTALGGKQDKLTFDNTPVSGSTNPITSGGVYNALDAMQGFSLYEHTIRVWTTSSVNPRFRFSLTVLNQSPTAFTLQALRDYLGSDANDYKQCSGLVQNADNVMITLMGVRAGTPPNQFYFTGANIGDAELVTASFDWTQNEATIRDRVRQIV